MNNGAGHGRVRPLGENTRHILDAERQVQLGGQWRANLDVRQQRRPSFPGRSKDRSSGQPRATPCAGLRQADRRHVARPSRPPVRRLLATVCQNGVVIDFKSAPGGHVVYVVREGHALADSYWTTRHFRLTQRVRVCAGIVK